ncbi:MAG: 3-deoxy-manno-octulosonate cytidylyltransferase [Rhodospirillaceae bacterium]|nr:3-deoxy-manno-octulosonate cytidylyltransferase [Rhodospirillaceae bacterium]
MSLPSNPIILIPARLESTRLPNKVLADIHGKPMIVHVMERAREVDIGPVVIAAGDEEIIAAVREAGGDAILTDPAHPSGSDRIFEALTLFDPDGTHDAIVNVQGDLPTIDPNSIQAAFDVLAEPEVDIATIAAEIKVPEERSNPNVVKAVFAVKPPDSVGRALYFTRATAPTGDGPLYHHIGLYAYRRTALKHFVALLPGVLEQREKLEQLRALEAGMRIDVALVDTVPLGVDTPADLTRAREMLAP